MAKKKNKSKKQNLHKSRNLPDKNSPDNKFNRFGLVFFLFSVFVAFVAVFTRGFNLFSPKIDRLAELGDYDIYTNSKSPSDVGTFVVATSHTDPHFKEYGKSTQKILAELAKPQDLLLHEMATTKSAKGEACEHVGYPKHLSCKAWMPFETAANAHKAKAVQWVWRDIESSLQAGKGKAGKEAKLSKLLADYQRTLKFRENEPRTLLRDSNIKALKLQIKRISKARELLSSGQFSALRTYAHSDVSVNVAPFQDLMRYTDTVISTQNQALVEELLLTPDTDDKHLRFALVGTGHLLSLDGETHGRGCPSEQNKRKPLITELSKLPGGITLFVPRSLVYEAVEADSSTKDRDSCFLPLRRI